MLKNLKDNYGTLALVTTSWDYLQSYLLCCAVDDNGWSAWRDSKWFMDENSLLYDDKQTISGWLFLLFFLFASLSRVYHHIHKCKAA